MRNAVIVDAVRTPVGRRNGVLKDIHAVDLAAIPLQALVERNDLDPSLVDDVIMGAVGQVGEQGYNVGRNALLAAGFPESVPGVSIDRQCGSSQQSVHFAAQAVMAGVQDIVIAAGVESMSRVPMGSSVQNGPGLPFGPRMMERYANGLVPQGISAEMIAEKWSISREELDQISLESHQRAARATAEGRFETQIVPVEVTDEEGKTRTVNRDEGIREDTSEKLGYRPRAIIRTMVMAGVDPVIMLTGPIPATEKALDRSGLSIDDIDLFEVNEAFASVIAAWRMEHGGSDPAALWERTNVNGGAIALGHPLGASGARLMTTLLNELERTGGRYGLQTMCEGGGMANATIIERV